jgi:acetyl-CoA synthetase
MGVAVLDENGGPAPVGTVGELALTVPWVGMTRGFWQAPERYIEAYWSRFPGVWVHGDWASVDEDGFWYIHGRSDDTIKIAGKRVGPAEFESVLVSHPLVAEAAAISVPHEIKGETVVCFAVLKPGAGAGSDALAHELRDLVAAALGKPLAPEVVKFVGGLPKTRNAKIMRRVIKAAYLGKDPGDLSALENPDAVQEIQRV